MLRKIFFLTSLSFTFCTPKTDYVFKDRLLLTSYQHSDVILTDDFSATLEKGGQRVRVKFVKEENITAVSNLMEINIKALFVPYVSPYPGVVSRSVICLDEFHPVDYRFKAEHGGFSGHQFFANGRFVPGECAKENVKYTYFRGLFACNNKSLVFDIEFFTPINNLKKETGLENFLNGLRCI